MKNKKTTRQKVKEAVKEIKQALLDNKRLYLVSRRDRNKKIKIEYKISGNFIIYTVSTGAFKKNLESFIESKIQSDIYFIEDKSFIDIVNEIK